MERSLIGRAFQKVSLNAPSSLLQLLMTEVPSQQTSSALPQAIAADEAAVCREYAQPQERVLCYIRCMLTSVRQLTRHVLFCRGSPGLCMSTERQAQ